MPPKRKKSSGESLPALTVHQWQRSWEKINFDRPHRARPEEYFYLFSIKASALRVLCGIERRSAASGTRRRVDLGIQRRHDQARSEEITRFIQHGYPWSTLGRTQRESGEFDDLKQPGWLPTAIVVNVRTSEDEYAGAKVDKADLVTFDEADGGIARVNLPADDGDGDWKPSSLHPIEVIDGQHRLWAFDQDGGDPDFEFPVVAFVGLDRSWQAYLFWTINIKPTRINASLAFDLYPLLRDQEWLERFHGPVVYRETRAQELTELMWAHEKSPWQNRINMLGEPGNRDVRQAAWVRSLLATFIRSYTGGGRTRIGGLFGAPAGKEEEVLDWTREQQAAYLIYVWQQVQSAVNGSKDQWAINLRGKAKRDAEGQSQPKTKIDELGKRAPFESRYSLLNTDQGVRGVLYLANDLAYLAADELALAAWRAPNASEDADQQAVTEQLAELKNQPVAALLTEIANALADFDWRTSATPGLSDAERRRASAFRGSSGYKELRLQLFEHVTKSKGKMASPLAAEALKRVTGR